MHSKHLKSRLLIGLFILICLTSLIDSKTINFTNLTNLNENFKYDPSTLQHLASNSITSFELLKNNNVNSDLKSANCGCPPKGKFISFN